MKRNLFQVCLLIGLSLSACGPLAGAQVQSLEARIARIEEGTFFNQTLLERMDHHQVPGVSIAVVNHFELEWARGYGVLERGGAAPVRAETLFQAASISKLVTAVAALH